MSVSPSRNSNVASPNVLVPGPKPQLPNVLAPSCKIEVCPKRSETRLRWALLIQRGREPDRERQKKPCAYWPSKSSMRTQKPFRMISLRKIRQQLPWIDILTKNTGGWGHIPFPNPPFLAHTAALGAGSKLLLRGVSYRTSSSPSCGWGEGGRPRAEKCRGESGRLFARQINERCARHGGRSVRRG